jgi:hydrogenase nickel incorporation protein HypA/HybF
VHELALAQGIVDICRRQATAHSFHAVRRVRVEIGALSHVEPEALAQGFLAARSGTIAAAAELEILRIPGQAYCMKCSETVTLSCLSNGCPDCGSHQLLVTGGEEMRVKDMEVD